MRDCRCCRVAAGAPVGAASFVHPAFCRCGLASTLLAPAAAATVTPTAASATATAPYFQHSTSPSFIQSHLQVSAPA